MRRPMPGARGSGQSMDGGSRFRSGVVVDVDVSSSFHVAHTVPSMGSIMRILSFARSLNLLRWVHRVFACALSTSMR